MTVLCANCHTANRDRAMFCIGCAGKLPAFAATGPSALETAEAKRQAGQAADAHPSDQAKDAAPAAHAPRGRLSPIQGHIEMSERGARVGRDVVSPLSVPARYAVLSPPPPTPPRRHSNNAFFSNDKNTASRVAPGTHSQPHRAGSGDTFSPIVMHGGKPFGDSSYPVEDLIDDIGDFTLIPSTRKANSSVRQHKQNHDAEDDYESYVV